MEITVWSRGHLASAAGLSILLEEAIDRNGIFSDFRFPTSDFEKARFNDD